MNHRSLLRILVSGVLVLALMLAWLLYQSHSAAVNRAIDNADNLAGALHGQFTATLRRIESNLQNIVVQLPDAAYRVGKGDGRLRVALEQLEPGPHGDAAAL